MWYSVVYLRVAEEQVIRYVYSIVRDEIIEVRFFWVGYECDDEGARHRNIRCRLPYTRNFVDRSQSL